MKHICYECQKELTWGMRKWTYDEIVVDKRTPPEGFRVSKNSRLCSQCSEKLMKTDSIEAKARAEIEVKARLKKAKENSGIIAGKCHWCKKQKEVDEFLFKSDWFLEDHSQCIDCNKIIFGLTSTKLQELQSLEKNQSEKISMLYNLHSKARKAEGRASRQKISDVLTGAANAGFAGNILPNSDTQFLENSAEQTTGSLSVQLLDARQEMTRISKLIKNERIFLAKEYFFKTDSKEQNEEDEPLRILKTRLAKGEITLQEFDKVKRVL